MHCPFCQTEDTKVIDSRLVSDGEQVRRRRQCLACDARFNTFESAELMLPQIIKRDDRRVPFDEQKLRDGIEKALQKRPVSVEQRETALNQIKRRLRESGEREIDSLQLGEWVMDALRELDDVAYVRFASVYRRFQDINAFAEEIRRLEQKAAGKSMQGDSDASDASSQPPSSTYD